MIEPLMQASIDPTPMRNTPIRIIVEQNAAKNLEPREPFTMDGWPILLAAALTLGFAGLATWLWWSRSGERNHGMVGFVRVSRRLGLGKTEHQVVLGMAQASGVDLAAVLLSETVLDHAAAESQRAGHRVDPDVLERVRQRVMQAAQNAKAQSKGAQHSQHAMAGRSRLEP
jgi:hypothetical protein